MYISAKIDWSPTIAPSEGYDLKAKAVGMAKFLTALLGVVLLPTVSIFMAFDTVQFRAGQYHFLTINSL
jgi:hypothetical protein